MEQLQPTFILYTLAPITSRVENGGDSAGRPFKKKIPGKEGSGDKDQNK
jgi:hypothetical protein